MPAPAHLTVTVKPGARIASIDVRGGVVSVRVQEPAREGKANEACRKALAKGLGVAPSRVKLLRGARSRVKVFALSTLSPAELAIRLSSYFEATE